MPRSTVPWSTLSKSHREFIDAQYLPKNFEFKDPSKMTVGAARAVLKFWINRQEDFEIQTVFRFKGVQDKSGEITQIPSESEGDQPADVSKPQRKKKANGKRKQDTSPEGADSNRKRSKAASDKHAAGTDAADKDAEEAIEQDEEPRDSDAAVDDTAVTAASVLATPAARQSFLKDLWNNALYSKAVDIAAKLNAGDVPNLQ